MIQSLLLQNFQAHKKSLLEFHPGVNAIIGDSDAGKSAILRSLYWLVFGKPSGDSMIRRNIKSSCQVQLVLRDGTEVTRVRGKGENYYSIDDEVYKGFGQSVPDPVLNCLNMNQINFARQMDPPFLFSMSAGEIAQYLNRLIDLDIIGTSLTNISRMSKSAEKTLGIHKHNKNNYQIEIKQYDWIDDAEIAVNKLERRERKLQKMQRNAEFVQDALNEYSTAQSELDKYKGIPTAQKRLTVLESRWTALCQKKEQYSLLEKLLTTYEQIKQQLAAASVAKQAEKRFLAIEKRYEDYLALASKAKILTQAIAQYQQVQSQLQKTTSEEARLVLHLQNETPDICPFCERPMQKTRRR